jgi:hypothetical protein
MKQIKGQKNSHTVDHLLLCNARLLLLCNARLLLLCNARLRTVPPIRSVPPLLPSSLHLRTVAYL